MRSNHLDRILGKVDDLDTTSLTILVQRLARERRLLETVFDTIHEGILVIDQGGVIEYSNQTANSMIGLKDADLGKAILWKLVPELARSLSVDELHGDITTISREIHTSYPKDRLVRLYLVPFGYDEKGLEVQQRYTVILSDITEEKISTEEMIENEKISSIFMLAAGVAHELGNPLNSVNIHLQLIKRQLDKVTDKKLAEQINKYLEACTTEVSRLDQIIENFLNAIKPTPPDLTEVNLLQLLDEILALQSKELENLDIKVEVELHPDLPIVLADKNQIKQAFFNLIKNAMEAMDQGGLLVISTTLADQFLFMKFADNGVGIDQEAAAQVFDPYYSTKLDGHGLGMMIVQRIMRNHGGHVGIDSVKGKGTVVTLQMPLKDRRMRMLEASKS